MAPFSSSELADIRTNLACTDSGALLKAGFLQLYHLQASVDDDEDDNNDETWRDLQKHGYDDNLRLVQDGAPTTGA
ncbi:hypothetical protein H4R19_004381 [Coemansia spiralis]|nr:hypothetical protein H4R19_004381 [Coemansia spiralis]